MSDVDQIAGWLIERARVEGTAPFALLGRFLKRYEGTTLLESVRGRVQQGKYGECLVIEHAIPHELPLPSQENAEEAFLAELRLLFGVGCAHEQQLREEGYALGIVTNGTSESQRAKLRNSRLASEGVPNVVGS